MIDVAPNERPDWADADKQLATLLADMDLASAGRDEEIKAAFLAAIDELDAATGMLGRSLVPAVVRMVLPAGRTSHPLRLPPVLEIIGFERLGADRKWVEAPGISYALDGDVLDWTGSSAWGADYRVVYHAGYFDAAVPEKLKLALRLMTRQTIDGHLDTRQRSIDNLLSGLRVYA